jgi:hypothetical protein
MTPAQRAKNALNDMQRDLRRAKADHADCIAAKQTPATIDLYARRLATLETAVEALEQMADEGTIRLPRKLTAENGYKAHMIGEFHEYMEHVDENGNDTAIKVPISWDTIKRIHDGVVAAQESSGEGGGE